jgi:probable HAF family extracellular repeat protein
MASTRNTVRAGIPHCAFLAAFAAACGGADAEKLETGDADAGAKADQFAEPVPACCDYAVQELAGLPQGSSARAMNERGEVVGNTTIDGASSRAFVWRAGEVTDLGTLGGSYAYAHDINDRGVVVGSSALPSGERVPFVWHEGRMTPLLETELDDRGKERVREGVAYAINEIDQVVGVQYWRNGEAHAFRWEQGNFTHLTSPQHPQWNRSAAWDINDVGVAVGEVASDQLSAAAEWRGDSITRLASSGASVAEAALSVTGAGLAVGRNTDTELGRRAAVWEAGAVRYLPFSNAVAADANDWGMVVGRHAMAAEHRRAFVSWGGTHVDLQTESAGNTFESTEAVDIDASGRVVGNGFVSGVSWMQARPVFWTSVSVSNADENE